MQRLEVNLKSQVDWNITLGLSLYNNHQRYFSFPFLDGSACVFRVGVCL